MSVIRRRIGAALRRFSGAQNGAFAVEFALIAPVLLIMTFGLIELLLSFLVSTTVETGMATAAREIRTGEFQTNASKKTMAAFKTSVCKNIGWLGDTDCVANLTVASRTFASFPELRTQLDTGLKPDGTCWNTGGPRNIVLVTASYKWRVITPLLRPMLGQTPDGYQTMNTMAVFQNEPFGPNQALPAACP